MTTPRENVPPHYHVLRVLWTVLQVGLLLVVFGLLVQALPPGELIGDIGDWARDL
jgi:hypothetical protein